MKLRVDPDVLFGPDIVTQHRTEMKVTPKPWTTLQDLVLWPVLLPCKSHRDYVDACVGVMRVLDHETLDADYERHTVVNVERRIVTEHMEWTSPFAPDIIRMAETLLGGYRSTLPLSWTEKLLIRKYCNREGENIAVDDLLKLVGRDTSRRSQVVKQMSCLDSDDGGNILTSRSAEFWYTVGRAAGCSSPKLWQQLREMAENL